MNEPHTSTPADPANHEPCQARTANCACCGGTRQPDPTDEFMVMLKELAELGMGLTRDLVAEAREDIAARRAARAAAPNEPEPEVGPELTAEARAANDPSQLAFQRMTRAVRLCMALALQFRDAQLEHEKQEAAASEAVEKQRKSRLQEQLARLVKEAIEMDTLDRIEALAETEAEAERFDDADGETHDDADDETEAERGIKAFAEFHTKPRLYERLKEEDIERDLGIVSMGELMARVCRDLEIEPDWTLWAGKHWAQEEARLGTPGSPYARRPAGAEAEEPAEEPVERVERNEPVRGPEPPSG